jgi:hypothetical protein
VAKITLSDFNMYYTTVVSVYELVIEKQNPSSSLLPGLRVLVLDK